MRSVVAWVDGLYDPVGLGPFEAVRARMMWRALVATALIVASQVPLQLVLGPASLAVVPAGFVALYVAALALLRRNRQQAAAMLVCWASLVVLAAVFVPFGGMDGSVRPFLGLGACLAALWLEPRNAIAPAACYCAVAPLGQLYVRRYGAPPLPFADPVIAVYISNVVAVGLTALLIGSATDDLCAANDTAERRAEEARLAEQRALRSSEAKARFLTTMSHELRTPLNAILGYADLLGEDAPDGTAADLARITSSGRCLLSLVDDVLEVARAEAAPRPMTSDPVDVRALLDELIAADPSGAPPAITVDGPPSLPVRCDGSHVRRILSNLVHHARQSRDDRVAMSLAPTGAGATLTIACGAAPDVWLTLAQRLARQSGASVDVEPNRKTLTLTAAA